jgi:hypothetical protein
MRKVGDRKERPITFHASGERLKEGAQWNDEIHRLPTGDAGLFPKGIYRYKSFEEANRHQEECLAQAMAKVFRERNGQCSIFDKSDWPSYRAWEENLIAHLVKQHDAASYADWQEAGADLHQENAAGCAYVLANLDGPMRSILYHIAGQIRPMTAAELEAWLRTGWLDLSRVTNVVRLRLSWAKRST